MSDRRNLKEENVRLAKEVSLLRAIVSLVGGPERASAALHRHMRSPSEMTASEREACPGCQLDAAIANLVVFTQTGRLRRDDDDPCAKFTKTDPYAFANAEAAVVVKQLEEFIKAVAINMVSSDVADELWVQRERAAMVALVATIGRK